MRGALLVRVDPTALAGERTLLGMTQTSLRHVMLSGLGRLLTGLLDRIAATGTVTTLTLHDAQGRLYHDAFEVELPPPLIGRALAEARDVTEAREDGATGSFLLVDPLHNEARCQRCHGSDQPLRGAIEVTLDTSAAVQSRLALERRSLLFALVTIVLVVLALGITLRITVIRPVRAMGAVADRVGGGELDVALHVGSTDEMGRLAGHLNDMIRGLRQKLALTRFVSHETLRSVESDGAIERGGVRRHIAVVFSDVRGFTAFSESHQPEQVVEMLNRVLHAQAEVVAHHGGDIDKFVGDELMARFDGDDCELRATRCAVELVSAVRAVQTRRRVAGSTLTIGVGVNAGEVVLGAVGGENRMDFTAIGDEVNLAARLCSAAGPEQVLVTQAIRDAVGAPPELELRPLPAIQVKGKKDPIALYEAVEAAADIPASA
jgi:adenylate cyclase